MALARSAAPAGSGPTSCKYDSGSLGFRQMESDHDAWVFAD